MRTAFLLALIFISLPALGDDTVAVVYFSADDSLPVGREFYEGDRITTSGGAMLKLPDGSDVELAENTQVRLSQLRRTSRGTSTRVELSRGAFRAKVPTRRQCEFKIVTPVATTGVRGTDFSVSYIPAAPTATVFGDEADVDVFEGTVEVTSSNGATETVEEGNGATANRRGLVRRQIKEKIRERWESRREAIIERMRQKLSLGQDDDVAAAIRERLKNLPPEKREEIRKRLESHLKNARERTRRPVKERVDERRDNVKERRQERRENRRNR